MDFGALPPEINSARMYAGPGSAPLLAAAAAWDGLVAELDSAAASYRAVIYALTSEVWRGAASTSMAAAAATYTAWMTSTAGHAEDAAMHARLAASAFQAAFAMTVPPPEIAANRSLLATLVATNIFGQNTPAIAATEAQYTEMWAQDAAAMYGYAATSASASLLTPFTPPAPTTKAAGWAAQSAAVAQAASSSAGGSARTAISTAPQLISTLPQALQSLAAPSGSSLVDLLGNLTPYAGLAAGGTGVAGAAEGLVDFVLGLVSTAAQASTLAPGGGGVVGLGLMGTGGSGSAAGALAGHVEQPASAPPPTLGKAGAVGALSVPPSWTTAAPTAELVAAPDIAAAEPIWTGMPPAMWSALPITQLNGNGAAERSRTTHRIRPGTKFGLI
jgi:PPE-repeat protein